MEVKKNVKVKKFLSLLLIIVAVANCFDVTAMASEAKPQEEITSIRASGQFNINVPGGTIVKANSSFSLEAGETVTIKASYTPFSASVDFGLIAPDGYFYYINVNNGSFDSTIKIDERGNYTFAVQNNSNKTISVSGYVNY